MERKDKIKIAIITDAWPPQVNGVVRTYQNIIHEILKTQQITTINPNFPQFKTFKLPGYKEIELVYNPWKMKTSLKYFMKNNYNIHIATEGPLGLWARAYLGQKDYVYTTSYHTQYPEFFNERTGLPVKLFYPFYRWFHSNSKCVMVPTIKMKSFLEDKGFKNVEVWTRGVNNEIFNPKRRVEGHESFILCVSRISHEKGLDDFCKLDYPRKVVIGDGPYLNTLKKRYKDVEFIGKKEGIELAEWYASAEAFVFPSKTDTFGIVILEAIASGTPVLAYPEPGPLEVINKYNGVITDNLQDGLSRVLYLNRYFVEISSYKWTWETSAKNFFNLLI